MQVSALIYTMGRETEHVLKSITLAEGDDSKIGVILAKVDEHFVLKRNIIHERARFHQRNQNQGETVESFVRGLYELAEHCDSGTGRGQHIRDRIVIGILNKNLSQKLQLKLHLTLETAIQIAHQSEMVKSQATDQNSLASKDVDGVRSKKTPLFGGKEKGRKSIHPKNKVKRNVTDTVSIT